VPARTNLSTRLPRGLIYDLPKFDELELELELKLLFIIISESPNDGPSTEEQ
jgi:hypothetical protein